MPSQQTTARRPVQEFHAKFHPGSLGFTPSARARLAQHGVSPVDLLERHLQGDWGDVSENDKLRNDRDIARGGRLTSSYKLDGGDGESLVWIITEADRSATTLLLPSEY